MPLDLLNDVLGQRIDIDTFLKWLRSNGNDDKLIETNIEPQLFICTFLSVIHSELQRIKQPLKERQIFVQSKKIRPTTPRRIKPINLTVQPQSNNRNEENLKNNTNSYDFNTSNSNVPTTTPIKFEIQPNPCQIDNVLGLSLLVQIHNDILENNYYFTNTIGEYQCLFGVVQKKWWKSDFPVDNLKLKALFNSVHNRVYFASKVLEKQWRTLVKILDKSTICLLLENQCLRQFSPKFIEQLSMVYEEKSTISSSVEKTVSNVYFNSETDNRENFPNPTSFHTFRKQRDLFYEIFKIWEKNHFTPDWNFQMGLNYRIQKLLSLSGDGVNFHHFCKLFIQHLIVNFDVINNNSYPIKTHNKELIGVDEHKLDRLKLRISNSSTTYYLEFYEKFLECAVSNYRFSQYMINALVQEIYKWNQFECSTTNGTEMRTNYRHTVRTLRVLGQFLAYVQFWPYQGHYSCVETRRNLEPVFDLRPLLVQALNTERTLICIPWLTVYLSLIDPVTIKLPYYQSIFEILAQFPLEKIVPPLNRYLIKFSIGWLFELRQYHAYCNANVLKTTSIGLDHFDIIDEKTLYMCCPQLNDIRRHLTDSYQNSYPLKHITPQTHPLAPPTIEDRLEVAFVRSQSSSIRQTIDFLSDRVTSLCVKYLCTTLVPLYKSQIQLPIDNSEQQHVTKLRQQCESTTSELISNKIRIAIDCLVPMDTLGQVKDLIRKITKKKCENHVKIWIDQQITDRLFAKAVPIPTNNTNDGDNKQVDYHCPVKLLHTLRAKCIFLIETNPKNEQIQTDSIENLLDQLHQCFLEQIDLNPTIITTICGLLLDFCLLLIENNFHILQDNRIQMKLLQLWNYCPNRDLFQNCLCSSRHLVRFSDDLEAWKNLATFTVFLLNTKLLTVESLEEQISMWFRTDWNQNDLRLVTNCLMYIGQMLPQLNQSNNELKFFVDFLADYCTDLS